MADVGGTTALHTDSEKSCRVKLGKKTLGAMIRGFEKSEKENEKGRSLKTKAQKTEIQWEIQESYDWSINSTD